MKRAVKSTVLLLICILMLSMIGGILTIKSINAVPTDWWPTFRHDPTHSGYSTSTAPTTNQTLWSYTTGDDVGSSPAVVDGVIFVSSFDNKVYALNASDGSLVWSYTTGGDVGSSPAVAGGVVFVASSDNNVYALNATNGSLIWSYTTGGLVFSSPAVADGVVFVGSYDNNMYALGNPYTTVGGERDPINFITTFLVPALVIIGIVGALLILRVIRISKADANQTA